MFTGIVRETGEIVEKRQSAEGAVLEIRCSEIFDDLRIGHSVSIDGVCLTVSTKAPQGESTFEVEATPETLRRTNLGRRVKGDRVNLEPSARVSDFLGGHLVQGHIDGTGIVSSIREEGNSKIFGITAPPEILRYCAYKGSISVNGVSLTISHLNSESFDVTIIPHTLGVTNFNSLRVGDHVNLETDIISKYVESHMRRILGTAAFIFFMSISLLGNSFSLGPNAVLVYKNSAGKRETQFVLRLARFRPDVFLEWESVSHQGTLHLYRKAVKEARKFSFSQLFEVGVDIESKDVMAVWLSDEMFRELTEAGEAKINFNHLPLTMVVEARKTFQVSVNKEVLEIPVITVRDDRKGVWTFHDDPQNPILVEYVSPYFRQYLKSITTNNRNSLRWIKKLPPVK